MSTKRERLKEAKELLDDGLLSEEQFKELQQQILLERGISPASSASPGSIKASTSSSSKEKVPMRLVVLGLVGVSILGAVGCTVWEQQEKLLIGDGYKGMLIQAGSFEMGCTSEQGSDCLGMEKPVHKVTISREFFMMESEVTQGLYESVMGSNPSHFSSCGSDCPVEKVSWFDAVEFANALSKKEGLEQCYQFNGESVNWSNKACKGWRLPTEAEWEYAARGNESFMYAGSNNADTVSWTSENSGSKTHKVCGKKRNGYELCDMSGNVNEWTWDWYGGEYSGGNQSDPTGVSTGSNRVLRGGSWLFNFEGPRVSYRSLNSPSFTLSGIGFRLGRTP